MSAVEGPVGPTLLIDTDLLESHVRFGDRKEIWATAGLVPTLTMVSKLLALLDLSVVENKYTEAEMRWAYGIDGDFGKSIRSALSAGKHTLSFVNLVQAVKEVVEFCDESSSRRLPIDDLARCLLGINYELDQLGVGSPTNWAELHDQMLLEALAQHSFHHLETIHTLVFEADETWRRNWPSDTPPGLLVDLPASPVELFEEVVGVPMDDFFYLGWVINGYITSGKKVVIDRSMLLEMKVPQLAIDTILPLVSLPIAELRSHLRAERGDIEIRPWARYVLQRFPVVELPDEKLLILRLQYLLQRFYGKPPYFDVLMPLKGTDRVRAKHFEGAIAHIFEARTRELLERIAASSPAGGGAVIVNTQMEAAWNPTSGNQVSTCDFAYVRDGICILIDSNYRALMQPFAEGSGEIDAFNADLKSKYKKKFKQLVDTVKRFQQTGWGSDGIVVDADTKFIPLVLAPDDGLPSDESIEHAVLEITAPMLADIPNTLPPAVVTWRDLLIMEGIVETKGVPLTDLLARWRLHGPMNRMLSISFQQFLNSETPLPQHYAGHQRRVITDFQTVLAKRLLDAQLGHLPPERRRAAESAFWDAARRQAGLA